MISFFAKRNDRATVSTSKSNVLIMDFWKKKVEGVRYLKKMEPKSHKRRIKLNGEI